MKSLIEEKTSKAGFDKDFFERNFTKKTIDAPVSRRVFAITANDLGENFWKEDFTKNGSGIGKRSYWISLFAEQINRTSDKNKNIDLTEYPLIFNLIKYGKASLSTKFNLGWRRHFSSVEKAFLIVMKPLIRQKVTLYCLRKTFFKWTGKTLSQKEIDETNNKIKL